jgi:hypothetical protein
MNYIVNKHKFTSLVPQRPSKTRWIRRMDPVIVLKRTLTMCYNHKMTLFNFWRDRSGAISARLFWQRGFVDLIC